MSITAILWAILYLGAIGAAFFVNPVFGSVGYLLEYYMRPDLKWWGEDLPALRYNLIVSVALGFAFFVQRNSLREMVRVPNPALRWLAASAVLMLLVTATVAVSLEISLDKFILWAKMAMIFPLLMVGVVRTKDGFNWFVAAHMLGAFWWGWNAWMDPNRVQGRLINIGSGDSLNDNSAAIHLLTVLPFTVIYLLAEKDKWLRLAALVALPFVVNTLILCNSRGAMVGLAAALGMAFFLVRSGYRMRMIGAAIGVALTVFFLADDTFIRRQQTTTEFQEDNSSLERLASVTGTLRLMQERPFGAGGYGFHLLSPEYIPEVVAAHDGELRAPHNTWALVLSEWGVLGMICFLGVYGSAFLMLRRVKKTARLREDGFYFWRAVAVQLAIVAFLAAATFTDRLYAEGGYWMVALSYVLYRMQQTDIVEETKSVTARATPEAARAASMWTPAHAR